MLGPKEFHGIDHDFVEGYQAIPDFSKELAHFAVNPFNRSQKLTPELFLEFLLFDKDRREIEKYVEGLDDEMERVHILVVKNQNKTVSLFENGKFLITFEKDIILAKEYYLSYQKLNFEE